MPELLVRLVQQLVELRRGACDISLVCKPRRQLLVLVNAPAGFEAPFVRLSVRLEACETELLLAARLG
jgi:hypothetical protein